ncbi:MAG: polysaccharide deacetylase family protein [Bacteroidetes bacterium]|nr:polysaccharide deacetylase family protein [Bacteroidota bacterium]
MLLILTASIPSRLRYIASLMVRDILGIEVVLTTSQEEFSGYDGPKISYGSAPPADGLFIEASGLLFETVIAFQVVEPSTSGGFPILFKTANPLSALPFDPFAAAFYLVTRYEEYHPHKKDSYGRFPATESIAWKGKFLEIPIVHTWAGMLEGMLRKHYPGLKISYPRYNFVPTIDVDHAWCYQGRTFARTLGGFGRSFMHGRLQEIAGRFKVLAGMTPDPYDNYAFINSVHARYSNFPVFFILFADYGMNDNNVTISSKNFHLLLRELDRHGKVGIHPSLSSNKHLFKLEDEYAGLCDVLDRDVTLSRQHFLKLSMPKTYRTLLQFGITDDYSMGYATHTGFRAGIAVPFPFFDLVKNEATRLMIHPVSLMDVTMKDYLRLSRVESLEKIKQMIQTVRSVNGEFVSLWHNESLGDTGRWEGWRAVYEEMVQQAST